MKTVKVILYSLAVAFGAFLFVYGGWDDSPGAQGLGLLSFAGGIAGIIRSMRKKNC
jgi:zinc transporter ZupT